MVRLYRDRIYQVLRDVTFIDVGLVFATGGRIPAYDLLVLKDDKQFFPDYAMAPVIRRQTLTRHPELAVHLNRLSAVLDDEAIAGLNRRVDVDSVRILKIAVDFLRKHDL